jgi:NAD(P)H-hydrate epimerase
MTSLVTSEQMQELDSLTINKYGVPSIVLMENAGRSIAKIIIQSYSSELNGGVLIIAGPGNNGGDGFVIARHLHQKSYNAHVCLTVDENKYTGDALTNLNIIKNLGINIFSVDNPDKISELNENIKNSNILIDSVFGTGLKRDIEGHFLAIIDRINNAKKTVVAVDMPSGICGTTGRVLNKAVCADLTVTIGAEKTGLRTGEALSYTGKIRCVDICIPKKEIEILQPKITLLDREYIKSILKPRKLDSHKGSHGHVGIFAGSEGKTGAAILASLGCLRSGAGLTTLISTRSTLKHPAIPPEIMTFEIDGWNLRNLDEIMKVAEKFDSIVMGPGIGLDEKTREFCLKFIKNIQKPVVLDADMLTNISSDLNLLKNTKFPKILTPHPGEMARLIGLSKAQAQADRIGCANKLSQDTNSIIILKGAGAVIASPSGEVSVNSTGNPGMATGGTGDVLSGILGALLAQGYLAKDAAEIGVYIHGLSADFLAQKKGCVGITASEIAKKIPYVIKNLMEL